MPMATERSSGSSPIGGAAHDRFAPIRASAQRPGACCRQPFLVDGQHGLAVHATVEQRLDRTPGVRPGRDEIDLGI